jgi:hypothetical protein
MSGTDLAALQRALPEAIAKGAPAALIVAAVGRMSMAAERCALGPQRRSPAPESAAPSIDPMSAAAAAKPTFLSVKLGSGAGGGGGEALPTPSPPAPTPAADADAPRESAELGEEEGRRTST